MSEISILLKLRRRSGVLAAAVAAVHRAGLTFQSQQAREVEGGPGLLLKAESDVAPEYDDLVSHLELVKGVDQVAEIQMDGEPLLPKTADPEPQPEPEPELQPDPDPEPEAMAADPERVEVESEPPPIEEQVSPRAQTEPETFNDHAEQDADPPSAAVPDDPPASSAEAQAVKEPDSNQDAKSKREMTRAVRRRWRRYR